MVKKIIISVIILFVALSFISSVFALTGSIGNARMILRDVKVGEDIEKYIRVKNVNNVSVSVELFASGDLVGDIEIKDKNFDLIPNQTKKAYFTIKVKEEGTKEGKVNVQFSPVDGGNGVGLSSTIVVMAGEGDGSVDFSDEDNPINGDNIDPVTGNVISEGSSKKGVVIALIVTAILLVILIVSVVIVSKRRRLKLENDIKKEVKKKVKTKPKKSIKKK